MPFCTSRRIVGKKGDEQENARRGGASNITKGIKNANVPAADTAVKIAQILNVSVEFLVTGRHTAKPNNFSEKIRLLEKYEPLVSAMELISQNSREAVESLVKKLAEETKI